MKFKTILLILIITGFYYNYSEKQSKPLEIAVIGLIHNLNPRGGIPDNQDSNGCHFNLSQKVFKFICSLETETEKVDNDEQETKTEQISKEVLDSDKQIKEI